MNRLILIYLLASMVSACDSPNSASDSVEFTTLAVTPERLRYDVSACETKGAIDPYAGANSFVVKAINQWVPTGNDVHCAFTETFTGEDGTYAMVMLNYGIPQDCPAGCIVSTLCAFGSESDLRLLDATWYTAGEKPLGAEKICDIDNEWGDLASSCPIIYESQLDHFYTADVQNFVIEAQARSTEQSAAFQACFF